MSHLSVLHKFETWFSSSSIIKQGGETMEMNNNMIVRESDWNRLMDGMDEQGKASVRIAIEKLRDERFQMEHDRKGNIALKKEMERIKEVSPKKILATMLRLQTFLMDNEDKIDDEVYEGLNDIIADPDNDDSLFPIVTDMIAVCDYVEPKLKREKSCVHHNPGTYECLTEAQKLIRAQDPDDKIWTMCPKCKRCMTIKYYNSDHNKRHVCQRSTEAQVVVLKEQQIIKPNNALELAKIQIQDVDGLNASLGDVTTGSGLNVGQLLRR